MQVQQDKHVDCMTAALPGWSSITNYDHHRLGRIWFCWSSRVVVTRLHASAQVITCAIQVPETREQFICSAIYASTYPNPQTLAAEAEASKRWNLLASIEERSHVCAGFKLGNRTLQSFTVLLNLVHLEMPFGP
ncbi:hypothetical protein HID58_018727 [Brassica napus]|uniref:Uncharacterized protein n=1 Tax=Brassica napus TaxID=3708 RepID=A0ABQ8DAU4_BRANA|nr:hypothetical protein HID58_018727 [Brassica napus]